MNKQDLFSELCRHNGLSKAESRQVVDLFFNAMTKALAQGIRVEIRGLCAFKVKTYDSYQGRNPKTGDPVNVKPKKLPFFKPGTDLKKRVDR